VLAPAKQDSPQNIAASIHRLVKDRDSVTLVVTATHVADCALKSGKRADIWRDAFEELTKNLPKPVLQLLAEHLEHRQGHRREDYLERVHKLCGAANLPNARTASAPPRQTQSGEHPSEEGKSRSGFFTKAKGLLGGLLGHGAEPSHRSPRKE